MSRAKSQRNFWLCLALEHLWGMYFGVGVAVVFYAYFGIDPTQIMVLQVIMGAATIIFDIPCGWLADRFGARRVLLVGIGLQIIQSTLFGFFCTHFWQFAIMLAVTGVAWSFTSGTTKAIVIATVPARINDYPARSIQARSLGQLAGIVVGSILVVLYNAKIPFTVQPLPFIGAFVVAIRIVDSDAIKQRLTHPQLRSIGEISRKMFIDRPHVRWIVLLSAIANASVLAMVWLVQPALQAAGMSIALFGYLFAVRVVGTAVMAHFKDRFVKRFGDLGAQVALITLIVACAVFAGSFVGWIGSIVVLICAAIVGAFAEALMIIAINKHMPEVKTHSTTVYSISSATQSALFAVSPLMGLINDQVSTGAAYFFVASVTATFGGISLYKYRRTLPHTPREQINLVA
ncbi:MAG: MFS transporter [Candidatus Saccharibacteria bacterium]